MRLVRHSPTGESDSRAVAIGRFRLVASAPPLPMKPPHAAHFPDTRWSLILAANGRDGADARAHAAVEEECGQRGKAALFARLREFLSWDQAESQIAAAARDLRLSVGAVRVAVHRLWLAFRRHLETPVAQTVATPAELRDEMLHLVRIPGG